MSAQRPTECLIEIIIIIIIIPVALEVVVIGDQPIALRPTLFYKSNCSKPNGSASPFGEAQLNDTELRSAAMAPGSRFHKNAPPCSAGHSNPDEIGDFSEQGIPASSNAGGPVPNTASAKYTEEDLQRITNSCMDSFLQAQASRPEPAGHREGPQEVRGSFQCRWRHWLQPHPVCRFVPPRQDQLLLAPAQVLKTGSQSSSALG